MLKHGLIMDAGYWDALKNSDLSMPSAQLVYQSVEIKNKVVIEDPTEKGIRKALNFGHTIGHAVESHSLLHDKRPLTHGEAIAIGMICEAYLANKKTGLSDEELAEIVEVINRLYPKYTIKPASYEALLSIMTKDKKNQGGRINCTLLTKIGQCNLDNICTDNELCDSLSYYAAL
jgi:3-dehydroquinate synthase